MKIAAMLRCVALALFATTACADSDGQEQYTDAESLSQGWTPTENEEVVGRWCDEWSPTVRGVATIVGSPDGSVRLITYFSDGTKAQREMVERAPDRFSETKSVSGDNYGIDAAGNLEMLDEDGHIRTAPRLGEAAAPAECPVN